MIQFKRLRLSGFKSFVDRTELDIGSGLNGVVGPNGCGKSNLVEALRWVMGESSAKRMRGGGMEDVIFAGTDQRSPRNIAEVSLILDNSQRQAPSQYNNLDEIEVIRRIERDKGSGYKINGKNARARDVQMLFADTVTGANSPALVSQGHVTRMINAKPHDRRLILEESAGISGLYARRHEAELRLKAADANLMRLEDVVTSMESRLNSLKRQARQASRYKNISAQIRQLELIITYLEWQGLNTKKNGLKDTFAKYESSVAANLISVTQLTKIQNSQIENLPLLRKNEAELSAKLQKVKIEFQRLDEEITRYENDVQETKTQLHQTSIDRQHEEQSLNESQSLLEKISSEHQSLEEEQGNNTLVQNAKNEKKEQLEKQVIELDERYSALKETAAETRAREDATQNEIARNIKRTETLKTRLTQANETLARQKIDENSQVAIDELERKTKQHQQLYNTLGEQAENSRTGIKQAEEGLEFSRDEMLTVEKKYTEFNAEYSMLEKLFDNQDDSNFKTVLDKILTKPGFEKALSRAMGDSLMASLDPDAPVHWKPISKQKLPELPEGAKSLTPYIDAPQELTPCLSQIGFVENYEDGELLSESLHPGQSIVSKDGNYWRWDGYIIQAGATDRNAIYLEQKNKLNKLAKLKDGIVNELEQAKERFQDKLFTIEKIKEEHDALLNEIKNTEKILKELTPALQKIRDKNLRMQSEQKHQEETITALNEDLTNLQSTIEKDNIALETLRDVQHDGDFSAEVIIAAKQDVDTTRTQYQNAVRDLDLFTQAQSTRSARIQAIADERISLKNRAIRAAEHLKKLIQRESNLSEKMQSLHATPINPDSSQQDMLDLITKLEKGRDKAGNDLIQREDEISSTNKTLKEAEKTLGNNREKRAHAQATLTSLNEQLKTMEENIQEKLNIKPTELVTHAATDLVKHQISDLPKLKQEKESLTRSRDTIGAVNLRAEEESTELETELSTLLHERNDLVQAIGELRGGINKINKEARERLLAAFEHVNAHFQTLFLRLFGGGKAYLKLIDSDDPLGAGLEIFAQPPGKALQSLSLLSGGEQTLASIALIFAMFLTNPSPICVLDEIDAPLDDANVNRVCNLIEEISERGDTRFLIITHHRLSMARMDRLYGVTMSEKGVSQLISVDLQQSFEFIDKQVA